MKTAITFRQMNSSDAIKAYVTERLEKLDRYHLKAMEAHAILSMERYLQVAEIVLSAKDFKATGKSSTNDMYTSIDDAISKAEKTLKRHHDKKVKAKTHGSREAINP